MSSKSAGHAHQGGDPIEQLGRLGSQFFGHINDNLPDLASYLLRV